MACTIFYCTPFYIHNFDDDSNSRAMLQAISCYKPCWLAASGHSLRMLQKQDVGGWSGVGDAACPELRLYCHGEALIIKQSSFSTWLYELWGPVMDAASFSSWPKLLAIICFVCLQMQGRISLDSDAWAWVKNRWKHSVSQQLDVHSDKFKLEIRYLVLMVTI